MPRAGLLLRVTLEACDAELWVNDVPLARLTAAGGGGIETFNHVAVSGENVFEVVLNPGPTPSTARTERRTLPSEGVAVEVHGALCPPGTSPGDEAATTLFRFGFRAPSETMEFPHTELMRYALDLPFGPWAWEGAEALTLDAALRQEATRYLQSMHGALARRSFPGFWAHNEVTHGEVAVAHDLPLGERRAAAESALQSVFDDPAFAMAPLVAEDFDFRLVAGGRLLECIAKDWGAIVRTEPDSEGHVMRFPISLGRVDGALRGLR